MEENKEITKIGVYGETSEGIKILKSLVEGKETDQIPEGKKLKRVKIKSVKLKENEDVYDISVKDNQNFFANGVLVHNCFEIGFIPVTEDGVCGMQFCNLTSINGSKITSIELFKKAVWAATIIGTLQAGYTNFPYLSPASRQLTEEESLLGVSITAMMDNPDILLDADIQKEMAEYAVSVNAEFAASIDINPAARVTCLKPEGTSTLALGSMASGIHGSHAHKMFRRIQANKEDNVYQYLRAHNPHMCEESVWSANKTDDVVTFPIELPKKALVKADLTALKHLEIIKSTQKNWVLAGTSSINKKPTHHNVSCTVIVGENEWDEVIDYVYDNREFFCAVSFIAASGDKDYAQAPNEAIITAEDEEKFNYLKEFYTPVDYSKMIENEDGTQHIQEASCAGGKCELI